MRFFLLLSLLLVSLCSFAPHSRPESVQALQAQYRLLEELHESGHLDDSIFIEKTASLEAWAQERFDLDLEGKALDQATTIQRINWLGSALYAIAGILLLLLLGPLLRKFWRFARYWVRALWQWNVFRNTVLALWKGFLLVWEPLTYVLLGALLYVFPHELILLTVSLMLGSLVSYSVHSRIKAKKVQTKEGVIVAWILVFLWGGLAYYFDHAFVGFMAVSAFVSGMGFSMLMWSHAIMIGLQSNSKGFVWRLTLSMFALSLLVWLTFYTEYVPVLTALRRPLRPFEVGLTSLVPLTFYIGLGYIAFFIYRRDEAVYKIVLAKVSALLMATGTLLIALFYQIGSMFWIGAFFTLWFLVDQYYELVYKRVDVVWTGLLIAGSFAVAGYALQENLSDVVAFLAVLGW